MKARASLLALLAANAELERLWDSAESNSAAAVEWLYSARESVHLMIAIAAAAVERGNF